LTITLIVSRGSTLQALADILEAQEEILQLATEHPEEAVRNSATLRHFAVEAYAYDLALPGKGCAGTVVASATASATSSPATATSSQAPPPSTTSAEAASTTSSAAQECHTHGDGVIHCA